MGILILVFTVLSPAFSWASELSGSLDDMAQGMATYFPKGTGTVVGIGQKTVDIEMPAGEGVAEGVILSTYRPQEPFYHPVTGVFLGHFEEEGGLLEVASVEGQRIVARPVDLVNGLSLGDAVRLTQTRIPIGIVPQTEKGDEGIRQEFIRALEDTGRFSVFSHAPQEEAASAPFYWVTFEGIGDGTERAGGHAVHVRLQNVKTQVILFDANVSLTPVDQSDFIVESFQQRQLIK